MVVVILVVCDGFSTNLIYNQPFVFEKNLSQIELKTIVLLDISSSILNTHSAILVRLCHVRTLARYISGSESKTRQVTRVASSFKIG